VDHISDINLTYSDIAREYLLREGLPADRIIKTGSPMFEVLNTNRLQIDNSDVLTRLALEKEKYFVVSAHREENINSGNFEKLLTALNRIAEIYQYPIIVSTHPRTRKKLEEIVPQSNTVSNTVKHSDTDKNITQSNTVANTVKHSGPNSIQTHPLIQFLKPLGFHDYNHLQKNAKAVLSDSGTISEESSIMNFPALNIREAHERPEAMEDAAVMMVGLNTERILQGLAILETQQQNDKQTFRHVWDYSMPNVSDKVLRIILSYTDYVNRVVWNQK
jgi:UDP-N-acetylglucosamine 2-epimerase (non-hydrolysing)